MDFGIKEVLRLPVREPAVEGAPAPRIDAREFTTAALSAATVHFAELSLRTLALANAGVTRAPEARSQDSDLIQRILDGGSKHIGEVRRIREAKLRVRGGPTPSAT